MSNVHTSDAYTRLMRIWDRMDGRHRSVDIRTEDPEYDGWMRLSVTIKCGLTKTHPRGPYGGRWECAPMGVCTDGREVQLCVHSPSRMMDQDELDAELCAMAMSDML